MSLSPRDRFRKLDLRKEIDRFFSEFPSILGSKQFGGMRVDVHETERDVIATCDIPGLTRKEDVNIQIEHNVLTISGTINKIVDVSEENMFRKERYAGRFHREVSLPSPVSQEGVQATYRNGVLEVRMLKSRKVHRRQIDVDFY